LRGRLASVVHSIHELKCWKTGSSNVIHCIQYMYGNNKSTVRVMRTNGNEEVVERLGWAKQKETTLKLHQGVQYWAQTYQMDLVQQYWACTS
jgi:hypothetical protein